MKERNIQLIVGVAIYAVGSLLFAMVVYLHTHKHLVKDIDQQLYLAAYATSQLLGDDFHFSNMNANSISSELDYETSMMLTDFVQRTGLAYVYSTIKIDDAILFVTSNATPEELENHSYAPAYFMPYTEASPVLYQVFADHQLRYSQYEDRWGEFRSVFIPMTSQDGTVYVVGADISLDTVRATANESALMALLACLGLGATGLPLAFFFVRSVRREADSELQQLYICNLTGLPNRSKLLEDIAITPTANVALINIDTFREINSIYGPAIGDDVLRQFAVRLSRFDASNLDNYQAYRINADEFAVMVADTHSAKLMNEEFAKLHQHITQNTFQTGSKSVNIRVRVGAAQNARDAFSLADMALREAKDFNKSWVVYTDKSQFPESYKKNFENTQLFEQALADKRIVPYYQPIVSAATGRIVKYECLARMIDDKGNITSMPNDFLPIAYRSRLYNKFSRMMLEKVISSVRRHRRTVSVNISISDIDKLKSQQHILNMLAKSGQADRIEFEILENQNIDDLDKVIHFIKRVKALGSRVGLDDLGKDYSNIDRLIRLPVDFVKIDGSIVLHLATDPEALEMAKVIIDYAKRKKLHTVAEYCCNEQVTKIAQTIGVDYLQGFYLGEPSPDFADDGLQFVFA